mmetsp:Transcript_3737/g.5792  ORF Transcript_3737/g.5792 Transcript_3737/m.5792 type:complete len:425 (-) Transcript_3737:209-1483(-)
MTARALYYILVLGCCVYVQPNHYNVLGVPKNSTETEIKKAYRKLSLVYHPDKIPADASDEYIEEAKSVYLRIQLAHEILSDHDRRLQYDLSLAGQSYDSSDDSVSAKYKRHPFSLFARSKYVSVKFSMKHKPPEVEEISIVVFIDIDKVYTGVSGNHTYYVQTVCSACGGNGGDHGECRKCSHCDGTGHSNHLFSDGSKDFIHVSQSTCGNCNGKGCVPRGKCAVCNGRGTVLSESMVFYTLPPGFPNKHTLQYMGKGHQKADGRSGNLKLTFEYSLPPGWSAVPDTLDLQYDLKVPLYDMLNGFTYSLECPNGMKYEIDFREGMPLLSILDGHSIEVEGFGLVSGGTKDVGALTIKLAPAWNKVAASVWIDMLKESGIRRNSSSFWSMVELLTSLTNTRGESGDESASRLNFDISDISVVTEE